MINNRMILRTTVFLLAVLGTASSVYSMQANADGLKIGVIGAGTAVFAQALTADELRLALGLADD